MDKKAIILYSLSFGVVILWLDGALSGVWATVGLLTFLLVLPIYNAYRNWDEVKELYFGAVMQINKVVFGEAIDVRRLKDNEYKRFLREKRKREKQTKRERKHKEGTSSETKD